MESKRGMDSNPLYPAYQKYFSALKCLDRFRVEDNFFDNISSLDTFFSEYRSTTLVLQKAVAHTPYETIYHGFPKGSWDSFMNDQRVKTVHKHPTEIIKTITLDVYLPDQNLYSYNYTLTIEDDTPLATLLYSARNSLEQFGLSEVFFSARFLVCEKESGINLWERILNGLSTMQQFMDYMYSQVEDQCPLCEQLRQKIRSLDPHFAPNDFATVFDYAYYPKRKSFERASRLGIVFSSDSEPKMKFPISTFETHLFKDTRFSPFQKFVLMHAITPANDFMPTIMTVYTDESCTLEPFHSELKTTFYRKINEAARNVQSGCVKEVFLLVTYTEIADPTEEMLEMTAAERSRFASRKYVVFARMGDDLEEMEYIFTLEQLHNPNYVFSSLQSCEKFPLHLSKLNMSPIVKAFSERASRRA